MLWGVYCKIADAVAGIRDLWCPSPESEGGMAIPDAGSTRIFISYRRSDAGWPARWLADRLGRQFGASVVFQDVESIRPGDDFAAEIEAAVGACSVLLAVIGPQWLAMGGPAGRRLDDPGDWVRLEIEAAVKYGILIIPVLVDGAGMPSADELPPSLRELTRRQAVSLSPSNFDTRRLVSVLEAALQRRGTHAGTLASGFLPGQSRASEILAALVHDASSLNGVPKVLTLASAIDVAAMVAPERVEQLAAEAESTARSIYDASSRSLALVSAASAVADTHPHRAEVITHSIPDTSYRAVALIQVAKGMAGRDLHRAEDIARSITDAFQRSSALAAIAETVAPTNPERARQLAAEAESAARSIGDAHSRSNALASGARALAAVNLDHARQLAAEAESAAHSIRDTRSQSATLASITGGVAAADLRRAEAIAHSIVDTFPQVLALATVAEAAALADPEHARQLAAEAESMVGVIQDPDSRWAALSAVAGAVAATDLQRAELIASMIQDPVSRSFAVARLARLYTCQ
jgi:TIR domain